MQAVINWCIQNVSLIVSVCALGLTLQQIWATYKHNRLSVRPLLATNLEKTRPLNAPDVVVVTASIGNCGLGPAIIKKFEVLFDGIPLQANTPEELGKMVQDRLNAEILDSYYGLLRKHHVMKAGDSFDLARITVRAPTPQQQEAFAKLHVRVTYESAYGDKQTYDSREHTS